MNVGVNQENVAVNLKTVAEVLMTVEVIGAQISMQINFVAENIDILISTIIHGSILL